jgi:transposase
VIEVASAVRGGDFLMGETLSPGDRVVMAGGALLGLDARPEVPPARWTPENRGKGGVQMARGRRTYPAEFRRRMVELVRAGRSPESLGKEFEPSANTIRKWADQADVDEGIRSDGLTTAERAELRELRRENRQLKLEREILGKAAAWFARESITLPKPTDS